MRKIILICSLLFICSGIYCQQKQVQPPVKEIKETAQKHKADSIKKSIERARRTKIKKLVMAPDTLTPGDYMLSIDRVNDRLNDIGDSAKIEFKVVNLGRRIEEIANDIKLIRQNIRDKQTGIHVKNLFLYQNFILDLDSENDGIQQRLLTMYKRIYHAKLHLKTVLLDTVFHKLYADSILRESYDEKLVRLEHKWHRDDSTTKTNIDTLNSYKAKAADNSVNLANMVNMMDNKIDRVEKKLFGQEVNVLWEKANQNTLMKQPPQKVISSLTAEQKAIGYYFSRTSGQRTAVIVAGLLLFVWLFTKRKLFKRMRNQKESFAFLNLKFLNTNPILALLVLLLGVMPFFDAYAPTSYIAIEQLLLLVAASLIFYKNEDKAFFINWMVFVALFIGLILIHLLADPVIGTRILLLLAQTGIILCSVYLYRTLQKERPYYKFIRYAAIAAILLSIVAIISNLYGRYSLSGMIGITAIFAITQAVVLPVFIETVIEIVLLQLYSSRLKKGVDKPFQSFLLVKKIKNPLFLISLLLWTIMLASNLNIYHYISDSLEEFLTTTRTMGNFSFKLVSVLVFFVIIWVAHILQQLISFLFGETGIESEDMTSLSKGQHSRLLITRLLVLIGGYMLAIAATGLPIDKLTFLLGALGIGIGMGLQNMVNNFVSGIILIFDGSLQVGDEIEVAGQSGKVKEIGLRASTLSTADGADVIIPNGNILSQNIVNWTFSNDQKRVKMEFSIFGDLMDANVINEVINTTIKTIPNAVATKKPIILYDKVLHDRYWITVYFWSTISNAAEVKSEAFLQLNNAFAAKNIGFK
jgi:potassium-dependent mechanosensitive channel